MRSIDFSDGCRIIENTGHLADVGKYVREAYPNAEKALLVTDLYIYKSTDYLDIVRDSLEENGFRVIAGPFAPFDESSKVIEGVTHIDVTASNADMHRNDVFVSLGGGVVCDTVGLAAALYMRGVGLCHIPTTIIAQCDAAVGGKCGVNLLDMKNRMGTFYFPKLVYIDTDVLKTLSESEYSCGMAEVIKYGAISDKALFNSLISGEYNIGNVIMRCLQIKCEVVACDERDEGLRHILNFGHTVGHAIEEQSKHKYTHGQAVAIGMYYMARAGEKLGITADGTAQQIAEACAKYGLKTRYKGKKYIDLICGDKKAAGSTIDAVFLINIGSCMIKKMPVKELSELLYELD